MGNVELYSHFIFRKEQKILKIFKKMLNGFSEYISDFVDKMVYQGYNPSMTTEKAKENNVKYLVDKRFNFNNTGFNIDIIFGAKKVFVISQTNKKITKDLRAFVKDNFEF